MVHYNCLLLPTKIRFQSLSFRRFLPATFFDALRAFIYKARRAVFFSRRFYAVIICIFMQGTKSHLLFGNLYLMAACNRFQNSFNGFAISSSIGKIQARRLIIEYAITEMLDF